ncbi:aldo/keto reductase [Acidisphaera sp. L21]|uniref:aldo/keto reductase n=1 Tax=Acidisphaera sp. L21 TaxID=1641851 RepID=UPI00131B08D5|nr:aldo/keto reductase [Acidisphaera sp. L21]
MRTIHLPDGTELPIIGQGTWRMGEGHRPAKAEADALRAGLDLGMTVIDTAEMYGDGGSEKVVGQAIAGRRDEVFLVSKVYPQNANLRAMARSCDASLKRMGTDRMDLYLLHWRGGTPLSETVQAFETLKAAGKILRWGVSNLDVSDMEELGPGDAATDQVLYNPEARGIEFDLLPWCAQRHLPVMAYSPVGQGGALLDHPAMLAIAKRRGVTAAQVAIAWSVRLPGIISIPKASDLGHVRENAAAAVLELLPDDIAAIDVAFPPPRRRQPLEML